MGNRNFFTGLKQVGRNNLEAWMQYMEKLVPELANNIISVLSVEKLLAEGMPKMALALSGVDLNSLTEKMYYTVNSPTNYPADTGTTKCFLLVMGGRKTNETPNPEVFQLLYSFEPSVALHYRYGNSTDINSGNVPWHNYRELLKGDSGDSAYAIWLSLGNTGTEQDFLDSIKGAPGLPGIPGLPGADGKSNFEIWKENGNPDGTVSEFLQSIRGPEGPSIFDSWLADNPMGTWEEFTELFRGFQGWTPVFAFEQVGSSVYLKVTNWTGNATDLNLYPKPPIDVYLGASGYVENIQDAMNVRGEDGKDGRDGDGLPEEEVLAYTIALGG